MNRSNVKATLAKIESMKLVKLVKETPAIFDKSSEGYHDAHSKDEGWNSICMELVPAFGSFDEEKKVAFSKLYKLAYF